MARKAPLTAALVTVLAASLLTTLPTQPVGAAQPAAPQSGVAVPELSWRACGDGLLCARARVPLDYDTVSAGGLSLALIKREASGERAAKGTIFVNPGGPGGSGVGFVRALRDDLFTPEVRRRFDIVGFDPRGIARSRPIECFDTADEAFEVLAPFPFPFTERQERRWVRGDRRYAQACAEGAGPIIDHMSTGNVARDLDLLRRAVGDRRATFVGYSYGSMIGSTYAAMYPNRVRAVVIDGVIDPIAWTTGRGGQAETSPVDARLRSEQGAFETLQQFLTLCDAGGDRCAFAPGDPRRRYARLARRLQDQPVRLPGGERLTYNNLVAISLGSMYSPSSWRPFARFLEVAVEQSRPDIVAARLEALRDRLDSSPVSPRPLRARETSQVIEGFAGVICSDADNPETADAWARSAAAADRRYPYFGRIWIWSSSICASWSGADADRFVGPFSPVTAHPVLVVGNRFDPATRYQDAVSTARILGSARLLTVEGWGHTSLFKSRCADDFTAAYLLHVRMPPRGATCRPNRVPFGG